MAVTTEQIITELKKIYDPEIPVNIWDMGLIYKIDITDKSIIIDMTFTSPTCPMMEDILQQVKSYITAIAENLTVTVNLVWEPAWDLSRMSAEAKIDLDLTEQGW
ncbi:MAG: iron-sulfur cluster assembly protein [Alphaproteobacteria bacterium]|nr:iron-sulfur cluster assembly protein [Alphaproteobacteria bacterium]